jgi:hypothetical protein
MKVFFSHFWPELQAEKSPLFLSLRENFYDLEITDRFDEADIVFYSIFGDAPINIDTSKKNFLYVGESENYVDHTFRDKYNQIIKSVHIIDSSFSNYEALSHFRFTEWMWQINWFKRKDLPDTYTLSEIQRNRKLGFRRKNQAAFVSRYSTHQWLSQRYSYVEEIEKSGIPVAKYGFDNYLAPGYRNKVNELKKYKIQLPFENNISPGYVTEKLLHGLLAGGISLYYGDDAAKEDFNPETFIHFKNSSELNAGIDLVKSLITSKSDLKTISNNPIFLNLPSINNLIEHIYDKCK